MEHVKSVVQIPDSVCLDTGNTNAVGYVAKRTVGNKENEHEAAQHATYRKHNQKYKTCDSETLKEQYR